MLSIVRHSIPAAFARDYPCRVHGSAEGPAREQGAEDRREHDDHEPDRRQVGTQRPRNLPLHPTALDDLLQPEVLRRVDEPVGEQRAEPHAVHRGQARRTQPSSAQQQHAQDEQRPVPAVVVADVDGREQRAVVLAREALGEEHALRERQPEIGRDPRQREQHDHGRGGNAERVAASARREARAGATRRGDRQAERERDAERRDDVDGTGVQVLLVDHAGDDDHEAERDREPTDPPCAGAAARRARRARARPRRARTGSSRARAPDRRRRETRPRRRGTARPPGAGRT